MKLIALLLTGVLLIQTSCNVQDSRCVDCVIQHALSDPEELTPINSNDNGATEVYNHLMQALVNLDFKTHKLTPVLAAKRPTIETREDGKLVLHWEIRPEAKWDNGDPITGHDVDFSLKVLLNPETDSKALKPYFDKVEEVIVDADNPKMFQIIYTEPYMIIESSFTDLYIVPSYVYDPEDIMSKFTVKQLFADAKGDKALRKDPDIIRFAEQYNSPKFQREVVSGSGPYRFDRWVTNQRVVVALKEDWWGHDVKDANHWFEAYPKEVIFESVNDLATAVVALKGEKLDAMKGIPPKDFVTDLRESESFTSKFNTYTPPLFSYDYMCFNTRLEKFADTRTRIALSHVMNVEQLIESFCYGLGIPVASFTHPDITERLNPDVKPYPHDLEKAKALLAEVGWTDSDGDGVLDMEIEGEKVDFNIVLNFNSGNSRRERACLIFQEAARKVGIKVEIVPLEWAVLLERNKVHDFEMFVAGWISSPLESDPKQIWHTDSSNDQGSNYAGFGNEESDALIEQLRTEMDDSARNEIYKQLHMIIHKEAPYIFLLAQKERIAINNRYGNSYGSGIRPGFWASGFTVSQPVAN